MSYIANRKNTVLDEHRTIVESCWEKDLAKTLAALAEHHEHSRRALVQGLCENGL